MASHYTPTQLPLIYQIWPKGPTGNNDSVHGPLVPLGVVKDPQQIARYLQHVGIDPMPPARAPPRFVQELFDIDQRIPGASELDG